MDREHKQYYYLALFVGLLFHTSVHFFTFEDTYDAYVHIFFADHYLSSWFDVWEPRWYTGFLVVSYPPLVHQSIAFFASLLSLKIGYLVVSTIIVLLFIRGVYKFSQLWIPPYLAGLAAIAGVFSFSFVEALHIFGQLPSIAGTALLLNTCPYIYHWVKSKRKSDLWKSLALIAVTSVTHHVTIIFGTIFFILPTMGLAVTDITLKNNGGAISPTAFFESVKKLWFRAFSFGLMMLLIMVVFVFPYWSWTGSDPISQVPIPHGSRDNFLDELSSGLMFFLIPWGMLILALPYIFYKTFTKRNLFIGISIALAMLLGTGGTTPIPRMLLGSNAFDILTFDRFTFWATTLCIPFWTMFLYEIYNGYGKRFLLVTGGRWLYRSVVTFMFLSIIGLVILIINLSYFQPMQPKKVDIEPIVNFLDRDQHSDWRYITLGFGDQMAWLSANTNALTVDGNYHSARRMPEFTTRAVERLENSKYKGTEGLGALHQFLTNPENYNLKYVFSNDKFYDPILFFSGWQWVQQLENNINVWEKQDVSKLPDVLPRKTIPTYQMMMWGILPFFSVFLLALSFLFFKVKRSNNIIPENVNQAYVKKDWSWDFAWILVALLVSSTFFYQTYVKAQPSYSPENIISRYFKAISINEFAEAHSYISPIEKPSFKQFMIELSIDGGILSSYSKLQDIKVVIDKENSTKNSASTQVKANWLTSISEYETEHKLTVEKVNGRWYIVHKSPSSYTPPDQFYSIPEINFHNQGRRKLVAEKTFREDEVDRPDVRIENCSLIKHGEDYAIIGEVVNVDNDPVHLTLSGLLLDESKALIAEYNVRDDVSYVLFPKERSPFKIDFKDAFKNKYSVFATKEKEQTIPVPADFMLKVKTTASSQKVYKNTGLQKITHEKDAIQAEIINYGNKEINVPQVLTAYYNLNDELIWVEGQYLASSILPQRKLEFAISSQPLEGVKILAQATDKQIIINGLKVNSEIPLTEHGHEFMIKANNKYKIDITINSFTSAF